MDAFNFNQPLFIVQLYTDQVQHSFSFHARCIFSLVVSQCRIVNLLIYLRWGKLVLNMLYFFLYLRYYNHLEIRYYWLEVVV